MTFAHVICCNGVLMGVVTSDSAEQEVAVPEMERLMMLDYQTRYRWDMNGVEYLTRMNWHVHSFKVVEVIWC